MERQRSADDAEPGSDACRSSPAPMDRPNHPFAMLYILHRTYGGTDSKPEH